MMILVFMSLTISACMVLIEIFPPLAYTNLKLRSSATENVAVFVVSSSCPVMPEPMEMVRAVSVVEFFRNTRVLVPSVPLDIIFTCRFFAVPANLYFIFDSASIVCPLAPELATG